MGENGGVLPLFKSLKLRLSHHNTTMYTQLLLFTAGAGRFTVRHGSDRQGTIFFTKALVHIGCSCMLHHINGWGLGYNNLCPLHGPSYLF